MNVLEIFKGITTFVFDVDGVMTDGSLLVMPNGVMVRRMNIKDGYALQLAVKKGYQVAVISGAFSEEVKERLNKLGINDVFMRVEDKATCLKDYLASKNKNAGETLFMGDDIPDHEAMGACKLPCSPADAAIEIKDISVYISPLAGGHGCVRDVIEKVLKLNGDWELHTHIKAQ
jgi:3-deoxy-D-manno-octulosonate 8-phosphate phosphatase (KDO 8-P phosphatase)